MDVRGELVDPGPVRGAGESLNRTFFVIRTTLSYAIGNDSVGQRSFESYQSNNPLESLILAQDERWRRA